MGATNTTNDKSRSNMILSEPDFFGNPNVFVRNKPNIGDEVDTDQKEMISDALRMSLNTDMTHIKIVHLGNPRQFNR